MTQVTKSTMIGELLQIDENIAPILLNIGMHCLGCPSSQMETIEEAAMVHGIEPDACAGRILLLHEFYHFSVQIYIPPSCISCFSSCSGR
mgnify:FL=1